MKDTKLYEAALGLEYPWHVTSVDFQPEVGTVTVHVSTADCPLSLKMTDNSHRK